MHYLVPIPKYFFAQRYKEYALYLGIALALTLAIPYLIPNLLPPPPSHHPFKQRGGFNIDQGMHFFMTLLVLIVPVLIHTYRYWLREQKFRAQAELQLLKMQINHHFLFNSLNSIYSLSEQGSPHTSASIYSLSSIMRYLLTETKDRKVPLEKEIDYIVHYIELQRLRLAPNVKLDFTINGSPSQKIISPMILLTFIENCFKHGISTIHPSIIRINIDISDTDLILTTNNTLHEENSSYSRSGIGLANVKQRLEYDYPNKHTLSINRHNKLFTVILTLSL